MPRVRTFSFAPLKFEEVVGVVGAGPFARPPRLCPRLLGALAAAAELTAAVGVGGVLAGVVAAGAGTVVSDIVLNKLQILWCPYYFRSGRCSDCYSPADFYNCTDGVPAYSYSAWVQHSYLISNAWWAIGFVTISIRRYWMWDHWCLDVAYNSVGAYQYFQDLGLPDLEPEEFLSEFLNVLNGHIPKDSTNPNYDIVFFLFNVEITFTLPFPES